MNYLNEIAKRIFDAVYPTARDDPSYTVDADDLSLFRVYALLVLTTGEETTCEDAHNAWVVWSTDAFPAHWSPIPFDDLLPAVQELDIPYRDAIRAVSREMRAG